MIKGGEKVWVKVFSNWSLGKYIGYDIDKDIHFVREDEEGGGNLFMSSNILPYSAMPNEQKQETLEEAAERMHSELDETMGKYIKGYEWVKTHKKNNLKLNKMEFKGIKGEWSFEQEYDHKYKQETFVISSHDTNTSTFASVWSGSDEGIEEAYANAKLIAKAPEMLEMLTNIFELIESEDYIIQRNKPNAGWNDESKILKDKLKQLIKEATEL
jgi:hypothetical protein